MVYEIPGVRYRTPDSWPTVAQKAADAEAKRASADLAAKAKAAKRAKAKAAEEKKKAEAEAKGESEGEGRREEGCRGGRQEEDRQEERDRSMTLKSSTNRQLSRLRKARWPLASPVGRIRVLLIAIAVVFSLCAGRALQVQAFDSSAYAAEAADQMKQTQVLPAIRGDLTDRYGDVLAYTEQTVNVIADPKAIATNGKMGLQPMTANDKAIAAAPHRN